MLAPIGFETSLGLANFSPGGFDAGQNLARAYSPDRCGALKTKSVIHKYI